MKVLVVRLNQAENPEMFNASLDFWVKGSRMAHSWHCITYEVMIDQTVTNHNSQQQLLRYILELAWEGSQGTMRLPLSPRRAQQL